MDWTYILVLIGLFFSMAVSASLKSTYSKYSKEFSRCGLTASEVAERILRNAGIDYVEIRPVAGSLTDYFDPRNKILCLSDTVRNSTSIAAIGVAAHECGHAIQHDRGYAPINWRNAVLPLANIGSKLSYPLIMIGVLIGATGNNPIISAGILLFSFAVIFQIVTLPVEFDASHRALKILVEDGILVTEEQRKAAKVLRAAAMTYVAAVANALIQLFRLIYIFGGRRRD